MNCYDGTMFNLAKYNTELSAGRLPQAMALPLAAGRNLLLELLLLP